MKMFKKIAIILGNVMLLATIFVAFGFIKAEKKRDKVQELDLRVDHSEGSYFIDKVQVAEQLRRSGWGNLVGMALDSLDLLGIEKAIYRNPFVDEASVFMDVQGRLSIEVSQREPVLRVVNRHMESYYVDANGRTMPISATYAAAVMVATGNINDRPAPGDSLRSDRLRAVFALNEYLREHALLSALFVQIYVNGEGEFELIPRVGNHSVLIGDGADMDEKMKKLLALYKSALDKEGWAEYRQVNLKFKDQVICKR
jgi:cell division protein FtsQ